MQLTPRHLPLVFATAIMIASCGQADVGQGPSAAVATAEASPPAAASAAPVDPPSGLSEGDPSEGWAHHQGLPVGDQLVVREVGRRPHDPTAFTQGLEFDDGRLFESRGLYAGQEPVTLTEIDPDDGSPLRELPRDPGDEDHFAEGLTVVDDRIIQITWREGTAYVHDRDTFERIGEFSYDGEGWGICDQPDRLVMSDGTSTLTLRDRDSFEVLGTVDVDLAGYPTDDLNELECVGDHVWANLWNTNTIVVIDPDSGAVVSEVDVSALADERGRPADGSGGDVLNGIAFDPRTGTWLLTGKRWPWMYEVEFECTAGCEPVFTPSHYVRPRI